MATIGGNPPMAKDWAVFVDRDGTLIRELGHLSRLDLIELLPRVGEAICLLQSNGLKVVMVTNQSAVARGLINEQQLHRIHGEIGNHLARTGAFLDGIYYCPHHPTEGTFPYRVSCQCRKPKPGLVQRACSELDLDATGSYVVGDQMSDMELATQVGAKGILIDAMALNREEYRPVDPGTLPVWGAVGDFWSAAEKIVQDLRTRVAPKNNP